LALLHRETSKARPFSRDDHHSIRRD
jgi:hypothetical protein